MKVKSKNQLEEKASFIFQDLEMNFRPCEALYILSEIQKIMSLMLLRQEQDREEGA